MVVPQPPDHLQQLRQDVHDGHDRLWYQRLLLNQALALGQEGLALRALRHWVLMERSQQARERLLALEERVMYRE